MLNIIRMLLYPQFMIIWVRFCFLVKVFGLELFLFWVFGLDFIFFGIIGFW